MSNKYDVLSNEYDALLYLHQIMLMLVLFVA